MKVKAHTSWWDVLAGRMSARKRAGIDLADHEAKKALREGKKSAPITSFSGHLRRALMWADWLLKFAED